MTSPTGFLYFFCCNPPCQTVSYMPDTSRTSQFEEAIQKLEAIVERMEKGDLPLEESLKAFEEGVTLTRQCQEALRDAEQRVSLLLEENGEFKEQPLADADDD